MAQGQQVKLEGRLAITALAICLVPLLVYLYKFGALRLSHDQADWASFGSYLGGILSPVLAFVSFIGLLITIRQQRDATLHAAKLHDGERYFQHAVTCLERAFSVVSDAGKSATPVRDRMAWLTCARLLLAARSVSSRISGSEGLRALYDGEEEYWRNRFYEYFRPTSIDSFASAKDYFEQAGKIFGEMTDERAIRTIYAFMEWPSGRIDPIQKVPLYTLAELETMSPGMSGIKAYVQSKKRFSRPSDA